jgi:plasmid stabilization system protein ParE
MDFKIVWSEGAIADLHQICSHIAEDNSEAALRVGRNIIDHVVSLARSRSLVRPIREVLLVPCERLFIDPIGSFMMCPRTLKEWKYSMSGMERGKNRNSEQPSNSRIPAPCRGADVFIVQIRGCYPRLISVIAPRYRKVFSRI